MMAGTGITRQFLALGRKPGTPVLTDFNVTVSDLADFFGRVRSRNIRFRIR